MNLHTRYERDVELPEPLFEQSGWHVSIRALAWLPLIIATLYAHHLVKVSRDAEDALSGQSIQI